jgi:predicted  nucleic acid-binding Zn-ribbon protein
VPAWLPGILVALVGIIPAFLVFQQADRARKDTASKATRDDVRDAFDTARKLYEGGIAEAERRIENCNRRVTALEGDLEAARVRERALRRWVGQLEAALRDAGVATPNGEPL